MNDDNSITVDGKLLRIWYWEGLESLRFVRVNFEAHFRNTEDDLVKYFPYGSWGITDVFSKLYL